MPVLTRNLIGRYSTKTAASQPNRADTRWIAIHHAAYIYPLGGALQSIFNYHSSKWPKYGRIGYHEVIQRELDGSLTRNLVNPPDMQGAGVWGQNEHCYHICAATDFGTNMPGQDWIAALAEATADAKHRYPNALIVGHTDITLPGHATACPGAAWSRWRPMLIAMVERMPVIGGRPDSWAAWGTHYPLPVDQRTWGIPSLWRENTAWLGEARSEETYLADGQMSVRVFQGGLIWWEKTSGRCTLGHFVTRLP